MPVRFILLMRHAARDRIAAQVLEVGRGLRDYIDETAAAGTLKLRLGRCFHPPEGPAAASSKALAGVVSFESRTPLASLDPHGEIASPYVGRTSRRERCKQIEQQECLLRRIVTNDDTGTHGPNAVLVVAHSPQIDWLLHRLLRPRAPRRWLPWYRHAFGAAEIICVDRGGSASSRRIGRGRVIWSLTPTDRAVEDLLRDKIKRKMESAKLLGGIVAAGVGFVVAGFHDLAFGWSTTMDRVIREKLLPGVHDFDDERVIFYGASIAVLLFATGLYCLAYLSYDRLLMPGRFWASGEPPKPGWHGVVWRPPSSSLLVLHQNMQRVWFRAFIPATVATGIALVLLAYATIIQRIADTVGTRFSLVGIVLDGATGARLCFAGVVLVVCIVLLVFGRWARPVLGAQD